MADEDKYGDSETIEPRWRDYAKRRLRCRDAKHCENTKLRTRDLRHPFEYSHVRKANTANTFTPGTCISKASSRSICNIGEA